ncbi:6075_t:CDS:1 [Entrophospora sp. SA101]|nr:7488_t:CDS:1 [Entrophospora sp. SA101]CAJ0849726.1 6075_t:CDS:1 [Entrophospora sp. SA101]
MEVIPVPKEFKCRNNHCIKERDKYLTPHKLDNIYCYLLGGDISRYSLILNGEDLLWFNSTNQYSVNHDENLSRVNKEDNIELYNQFIDYQVTPFDNYYNNL